jgi:hypothetical protein
LRHKISKKTLGLSGIKGKRFPKQKAEAYPIVKTKKSDN